MENREFEFKVPYYIFEEVIKYIEITAKGNNGNIQWERVKMMLNMAVLNNNLTREQANYIKMTYCRES